MLPTWRRTTLVGCTNRCITGWRAHRGGMRRCWSRCGAKCSRRSSGGESVSEYLECESADRLAVMPAGGVAPGCRAPPTGWCSRRGHSEGRRWRGFHHHATWCIAAYGFLVSERNRFFPLRPRRPYWITSPGAAASAPSGTIPAPSLPSASALLATCCSNFLNARSADRDRDDPRRRPQCFPRNAAARGVLSATDHPSTRRC